MWLSTLRSCCFPLGCGWTSAGTSTPWCWPARWTRPGSCGGRCSKSCIWELTQPCRFCRTYGLPRLQGPYAVSSLAKDVSWPMATSDSLLWEHGRAVFSQGPTSPRAAWEIFHQAPYERLLLALQMVASSYDVAEWFHKPTPTEPTNSAAHLARSAAHATSISGSAARPPQQNNSNQLYSSAHGAYTCPGTGKPRRSMSN